MEPALSALNAAGIRAQDLTAVLTSGGACRMPRLREVLSQTFDAPLCGSPAQWDSCVRRRAAGSSPGPVILCFRDPGEVTVLGAARHAGIVARVGEGKFAGAGEETTVAVCAATVGVADAVG